VFASSLEVAWAEDIRSELQRTNLTLPPCRDLLAYELLYSFCFERLERCRSSRIRYQYSEWARAIVQEGGPG
jgi:DNA primase large subunit